MGRYSTLAGCATLSPLRRSIVTANLTTHSHLERISTWRGQKGGGAGGSRASRVLRCYVHLHHVTLDVKTRRLHGVGYPCIASLALAPREDVDDGHTLLYPLTYTKTLLS